MSLLSTAQNFPPLRGANKVAPCGAGNFLRGGRAQKSGWKIGLVQNRRGSTRYFQKSRCGGPRLQAAQVPRGGALARGHPRWTHRRLCSGDCLLYDMNSPAASHGLVLSFGHLYREPRCARPLYAAAVAADCAPTRYSTPTHPQGRTRASACGLVRAAGSRVSFVSPSFPLQAWQLALRGAICPCVSAYRYGRKKPELASVR